MADELCIRHATRADCGVILSFIQKLAEYEKRLHEVVATEQSLMKTIFDDNGASVLIGEEKGKPVAFALYFHTYSTFLGCQNIYLEDLFVLPEKRGSGYGKAMLTRLAQIAVQEGCGRLDWACLTWNTPSIAFYKSLGAEQVDEWLHFRLHGEALSKLGQTEEETG